MTGTVTVGGAKRVAERSHLVRKLMQFDNLLYEERENVALLTMNRPEKLNALSQELLSDLRAALDTVDGNEDVHAVILTGSGRAFSSGFDLTPPTVDGTEASRPMSTPEWLGRVKSNFDTLLRIWNLRQPVVAAVNGHAIAAGCDLSMVCDITIASDQALFGEPENRHLALSPLILGPYVGPMKRMAEWYYTGDTVDADTAVEFGIANRTVPHDELMNEAWRVARRIAMVPSFATSLTKSSIKRTYELMGFRQAQDQHRIHDTLILQAQGIMEKDRLNTIRAESGLKAFLEARDGRFR